MIVGAAKAGEDTATSIAADDKHKRRKDMASNS
jgi:hypothetical protein